MRAVLFAGADGHEQARVTLQMETDGIRVKRFQMQRSAHLVIAGGIAATAACLPPEAAFDRLDDAVGEGSSHLERGVVVLDGLGEPFAWAGRHRFFPATDSAELRAIITPFYVALEARRQANGRTAVGT